MSEDTQRLHNKLLRKRFTLEDTINVTQEDIDLLAELVAELVLEPIPDAEKTPEERLDEQRLLSHLNARNS